LLLELFYVYILYSRKIDKYYIGYSENPEKRLDFHNSEFNKIWSKRGQQWLLKLILEFDSKTEALRAERLIKRKKRRAYIEAIIDIKSLL
jgi:putative endonuclease